MHLKKNHVLNKCVYIQKTHKLILSADLTDNYTVTDRLIKGKRVNKFAKTRQFCTVNISLSTVSIRSSVTVDQ